MLVSCKQFSLKNIWLGRRVRQFHPRIIYVVRKHLSVLHAAIDINDVKQAFGHHLVELTDESVPFPDSSTQAAQTDHHHEDTQTSHARNQTQSQSQPQPQPRPQSQSQSQSQQEPPPTDHYQLAVGYGWSLDFRFIDGEARGVNLECDSKAMFLAFSGGVHDDLAPYGFQPD